MTSFPLGHAISERTPKSPLSSELTMEPRGWVRTHRLAREEKMVRTEREVGSGPWSGLNVRLQYPDID